MGLFRKKQEVRATGEVEIDDPLLQALLEGRVIDKNIAMQIPTVSGAVDIIASVVASTPIKLYKDNEGKAYEVKDDRRTDILNDETGDTLNASDFWKAIVRDYYLGQGGYAYIHKQRGEIKSLHYVDEAEIVVMKNTDPIFKDFDILVREQVYKPFDFLKILRNTKDGATGIPITRENSKLIEVAFESLQFENNMVKRGGNKKGFLKASKRIDSTAMSLLKTAFSKLYSNSSDNMVVLNDGIDFKESSNTAAELQLNENKQANAEEFAKIFHISADLMAGKVTQEDTASFVKLAVIPLMEHIQRALNKDLLLEREKKNMYFAFDKKELLKGDMKERFEAYKVALDANFMQIDEVRYAEDLAPIGMKWIKLGLQDVLYDPETKTVYTPNTNKTSEVGTGMQEVDAEEDEE